MAAQPTGKRQNNIPVRRDLTPLSVDAIEWEPTLERVLVENGTILGERLEHGRIDQSILEAVMVIEANADAVIMRNVLMTRCDWSNTSAESSSWSNTEIDGCKLIGTKLNRAVLKDVTVIECRADFVQLQEARLQSVIFDSCNLQNAFFNSATLPKTVFSA